MPTFTAAQAAASFPVYESVGRGLKHTAFGVISLTSNVAPADILQFCYIPAGATVIGGRFRGTDIDTNATATLDIDIGWAANGAEAADTDGFGNFGVINGSAVTNYLPEGGFAFPLAGVLATGPVTFTNKTLVTGVVNAAAATFAAGTIWVEIDYVVQ